MAKLRLGKPRRSTDAPTHMPGTKQGNSMGNYEKQAGHLPDGRSTAAALDRHQRRQAGADRPAHAEPARRPRRRVDGADDEPAPLGGRRPSSPSRCGGAAPVEHAAVPTLAFAIAMRGAGGAAIRSVLLDVQVQIAARRRAYDDGEQQRLFEVFGAGAAGATTLRTLLWTRTTLVIPPFTGATTAELLVPCSYDIDVRAARYLDALGDGEVPLEFLFSGTVFYAGPGGAAADRADLVGAGGRLPAAGRACGARRWTGTSPARRGCGCDKERFDRLAAYKARHALASWDDALDALLPGGAREARRDRPVRAIADAVLYEGYLLWPYRRSAIEEPAALDVRRRAIRARTASAIPTTRAVMRAAVPARGRRRRPRGGARALPARGRAAARARTGEAVDELTVGGKRHLAWDEAVEREVGAGRAARRARRRDGADRHPGRARGGALRPAAPARSCAPGSRSRARSTSRPSRAADGVARRDGRIANTTPWAAASARRRCGGRSARPTRCCASRGGAFVSLTDPPERCAPRRRCRNEGAGRCWSASRASATRCSSSPIILEDHPRIAPESPGDLFDGGEIDQLLVLSILSLTDEEKAEMRATDPRAREILERTEALTPEQLMRLHGAIRESGWRGDERWLGGARAAAAPRRVVVDGVEVAAAAACGCARARAATCSTSRWPGATAVVEAIERGHGGRVQLAVERRGRPGARPRRARQPGPPVLLRARRGRAAAGAGAAARPRMLVAGIGNVFLGDDGFGVAVARRLAAARAAGRRRGRRLRHPRHGPRLRAAATDYDAAVLLDAVPRGERARHAVRDRAGARGRRGGARRARHGPGARCSRLARALGGTPPRTLVVGCEPRDADERRRGRARRRAERAGARRARRRPSPRRVAAGRADAATTRRRDAHEQKRRRWPCCWRSPRRVASPTPGCPRSSAT